MDELEMVGWLNWCIKESGWPGWQLMLATGHFSVVKEYDICSPMGFIGRVDRILSIYNIYICIYVCVCHLWTIVGLIFQSWFEDFVDWRSVLHELSSELTKRKFI